MVMKPQPVVTESMPSEPPVVLWALAREIRTLYAIKLDCDAGTLTVKKNGTVLGVAVAEGLTGDLCWAVAVHTAERARIKAVDPAEF